MTDKLSTAATDVLHRKLDRAGGTGIDVDRLSPTELKTLETLVRRNKASISFGRAFRVLR